MATNSILGNNFLTLGPANMYYKKRFDSDGNETDWESDSDYVFAGKTESATLRLIMTKTDLMASQDGTRPSDKTVTAQQAQLETSLGQSTLERLEFTQQGLRVERNSAGDVTRFLYVDVLGERDSDTNVELWVKFVEIERGAESTNPLKTTYMKAAPQTEQTELVFDAATQRFYGLMFEAYKHDAGDYVVTFQEDGVDKYPYYWSGEVI
jgi:hypothetical protein